MATHCSILAGKSHGEEPGRLQSGGRTWLSMLAHTYTQYRQYKRQVLYLQAHESRRASGGQKPPRARYKWSASQTEFGIYRKL